MSYKSACFVSAALLLLALADLPYGFYTFLRIVVSGTAAFGAFSAHSVGQSGWMIALGFVALLFNPVFPIYFGKPLNG